MAIADGRARWGCHECEHDDRVWDRRGRCGRPMAVPVQVSRVAPVPRDADIQCSTCPLALARAPWVAGVFDIRIRLTHAPLDTLVCGPVRPALVEALDVLRRTARLYHDTDAKAKADRADAEAKLRQMFG